MDQFLGYAAEEVLEATVIAEVSFEKRVRMAWNGDAIVDLSREFLKGNIPEGDVRRERAGEKTGSAPPHHAIRQSPSTSRQNPSRDKSPRMEDRKSTRLNSSHITRSRMPSSA